MARILTALGAEDDPFALTPLIGKLVWGGGNFAHSASQIHLSLEGKEGTPWLHAQLNDRHGSVQSASVSGVPAVENFR